MRFLSEFVNAENSFKSCSLNNYRSKRNFTLLFASYSLNLRKTGKISIVRKFSSSSFYRGLIVIIKKFFTKIFREILTLINKKSFKFFHFWIWEKTFGRTFLVKRGCLLEELVVTLLCCNRGGWGKPTSCKTHLHTKF